MAFRHVFASPWVLHFIRFISVADRKSTRLNSSHSQISYAVFCLKKKTDALVRFEHAPNRHHQHRHARHRRLPPVTAAGGLIIPLPPPPPLPHEPTTLLDPGLRRP